MRVIILGASGQIGKQIYKELKNNPSNEVIGTSRRAANDFLKFDPFKDNWSILGKADVLINSIGQIEESKEYTFDKVHRELTLKIMEHRTLLGNPKIIQVSVLGASTDSEIDFLKTKGIADEHLLKLPNTIVVRASIVCTRRTMLVKKMGMLASISKFSFGNVFVPAGFLDHKIQPVLCEDLAVIIANICKTDSTPSIIKVVGPDPISYRQLISLLFQVRGKRVKLVELSRKLTDLVVKRFVGPFFPSIINEQQYHLLFHDNIGDKSEAERYLGKPLTQTFDFWKNEFR